MVGTSAAVRVWARHQARRRVRSIVVLGLLAGVTAGLAASAFAGARRTDSAFDRLHEASRGADAIVFATYDEVFDADWAPILEDPAVEAAGTFALAPVELQLPDDDEVAAFMLPPSGELYVGTEVPVVADGRRPDPDRADEIWINQAAADELDLSVGDTLTLDSYLDIEAFFGDVADARPGPTFPVTITGIGKIPIQFTWMGGSQAYLTRAVLADHPEIPAATNLVVRLRDGADGLPRLRELVAEHVTPTTPILDLVEAGQRVKTSTDVERNGLLLFGLAVAAAGLLIVGQAVVRTVQASAEDAPTLHAMGLVRRELAAAFLLPVLPAAALAGITAAIVAVALSGRYPIGLARQIEPAPGLAVDGALVIGVSVATVLAVTLIGGVAAASRARHAGVRTGAGSGRWSERALAPLGLPLPAVVGARFALTSGRGSTSLPALPAIIGSITAVVGIVAAFTLGAGIDDAIDDPSLVGSSWDATAYAAGDTLRLPPGALADVEDSPTVAEYAVTLDSVGQIAGEPTPLFSLDPRRGSWGYRLLEGREPAAGDEVVLGPDTLAELGVDIGDTLELGSQGELEVRVVGTALLQQGVHWAYDQGAWLTPSGIARVAEETGSTVSEGLHLRWALETDVAAATAELERIGLIVEAPTLPQTLENLQYVRRLPFLLAGFLVLLGVGAVGHSLVTAVRRRRQELAVLRSLGMTPRQAWASSAWQATTLALVGLVVGLPVGVALGRTLWRWIAEAAPIFYVPPLALTAVLLAIPATVLLTNALAVLPGRSAARLRPATVLRSE